MLDIVQIGCNLLEIFKNVIFDGFLGSYIFGGPLSETAGTTTDRRASSEHCRQYPITTGTIRAPQATTEQGRHEQHDFRWVGGVVLSQ